MDDMEFAVIVIGAIGALLAWMKQQNAQQPDEQDTLSTWGMSA